MTNEEKAKEIAWETSKHYDPYLGKNSWCELAAMDMAKYKDEQLKQILENIHEDCPKSKARHYLTLLKNNAL